MVDACKMLIDNSVFAKSIGHQSWLDCRDRNSPITVAEQTLSAYREAKSIFKRSYS
jgi:hypothetical protein